MEHKQLQGTVSANMSDHAVTRGAICGVRVRLGNVHKENSGDLHARDRQCECACSRHLNPTDTRSAPHQFLNILYTPTPPQRPPPHIPPLHSVKSQLNLLYPQPNSYTTINNSSHLFLFLPHSLFHSGFSVWYLVRTMSIYMPHAQLISASSIRLPEYLVYRTHRDAHHCVIISFLFSISHSRYFPPTFLHSPLLL